MKNSKIHVVIRKRPVSQREKQTGDQDIIDIDGRIIVVNQPKQKIDLTSYVQEKKYSFDAAYDEKTSNQLIYREMVQPLIFEAFHGMTVSCFAYGQTGSGKTYTMLGDENNNGIKFLAILDIYKFLPQFQFTIHVSFFEIYCDKLYDLLNGRTRMEAREDAKGNINIVPLEKIEANTIQFFVSVIKHGMNNRKSSENGKNIDSSRSHAILQITLKKKSVTHGRISFIDLAGSQRGADNSSFSKQTKTDGAEINTSLLALKECIRALDNETSHIPFRQSTLTKVLKECFSGQVKTLMIATISPNLSNIKATMNTLEYAHQVKDLRSLKKQKSIPSFHLNRKRNPSVSKVSFFDSLATKSSYPSSYESLIKKERKSSKFIKQELPLIFIQHSNHLNDLKESIKKHTELCQQSDENDTESYLLQLSCFLEKDLSSIRSFLDQVRKIQISLKGNKEVQKEMKLFERKY